MSEAEVDRAIFDVLERQFNAAMVSNDVKRIAACISSDWVLVTPERGPIAGQFILDAIECKVLLNTGTFQGQPIAADEWVTDVYRRADRDR